GCPLDLLHNGIDAVNRTAISLLLTKLLIIQKVAGAAEQNSDPNPTN
ncbi:MAG: hypothetical protein IPP17_31070, partial [Bacteroidetes bacterium]|nr:hypothetical protein [Bacteroidota bacterium]